MVLRTRFAVRLNALAPPSTGIHFASFAGLRIYVRRYAFTAMRKHIPLVVAIVTVAITVVIASRFVSSMRRLMALQADPNIRLPVGPRDRSSDHSPDTITLTLAAGGAVYADGAQLSDASLSQLLAAKPAKNVVVHPGTGVSYEQMRMFLSRLQASGVSNIALKIRD